MLLLFFKARAFHCSVVRAAHPVIISFKQSISPPALLHGVLGRPFSRCTVVPGSVGLEQLRNVRNQRVIGVGVGQERANTQQNLTDRQCWTPLVLENVKTDTAVRVDVAVVDACGKVNFGRLQSDWFSIGVKING